MQRVKEFGENLKRVRERKNVTQEEFAVMLGVSKITIAQWEQGRREPNLEMLTRLTRLLDTKYECLLDGKEDSFILCRDYEKLIVQFNGKEIATITCDEVIAAEGVTIALTPSKD